MPGPVRDSVKDFSICGTTVRTGISGRNALPRPVQHGLILQRTLATLVAYRAGKGVIGEQEFDVGLEVRSQGAAPCRLEHSRREVDTHDAADRPESSRCFERHDPSTRAHIQHAKRGIEVRDIHQALRNGACEPLRQAGERVGYAVVAGGVFLLERPRRIHF